MYNSWIDPDGEEHFIDQWHEKWAKAYIQQHNLKIPDFNSMVEHYHQDYIGVYTLLYHGWIRRAEECNFTVWTLDREKKDIIFILAKKSGCEKIKVDDYNHDYINIKVSNQPPEALYESKISLKKLILESVIDIDASFIKDELNKNVSKFTSDLSSLDVVTLLNDIFFQHSIYFDIEDKESNRNDYAQVGVVEGYIDEALNIHILLNNDIWEELDDPNWFKSFSNVLNSVISHELVHREQLTRASEIKPVNMASNFTYLSDKREIMANAKSAVNEFLNLGYSKEQILKKLREPRNKEIYPSVEESEVFWQYLEHFGLDEDDPVMKLFLTYMYQYLTRNITEQKTKYNLGGVASIDIDPAEKHNLPYESIKIYRGEAFDWLDDFLKRFGGFPQKGDEVTVKIDRLTSFSTEQDTANIFAFQYNDRENAFRVVYSLIVKGDDIHDLNFDNEYQKYKFRVEHEILLKPGRYTVKIEKIVYPFLSDLKAPTWLISTEDATKNIKNKLWARKEQDKEEYVQFLIANKTNLREQKNYVRYFAWVDPRGKIHPCPTGTVHDDFAASWIKKNDREMWKLLGGESESFDSFRKSTEYLLKLGWTRQSDCSFEVDRITKTIVWNIHDAAKEIGCGTVFVSSLQSDYDFVELPLDQFIEEYG